MKIKFLLSIISFIFLHNSISGQADNKKEEKKLTYSEIINKDYVKKNK